MAYGLLRYGLEIIQQPLMQLIPPHARLILIAPRPKHALKAKDAKSPMCRPPRSQIDVPELAIDEAHAQVEIVWMGDGDKTHVEPLLVCPRDAPASQQRADAEALFGWSYEEFVEVCSTPSCRIS